MKEKAVDIYIENAAEFARPVLNHFRNLVHEACPEVEEKIKWKMPTFNYKGMMCSMAAFKQHCAIGFWKESLMSDPHHLFERDDKTAMGSLGKLTSKDQLPGDDLLLDYIREAVRLNESGKKLPSRGSREKSLPEIPEALKTALENNPKAGARFHQMPYSHKKEYIEWIAEAKREETRQSRIEKAVEMISEGLSRNYRYEKK
jgi:uncharacterized protein YdeI (YjbR/CyaY-like superfamily)